MYLNERLIGRILLQTGTSCIESGLMIRIQISPISIRSFSDLEVHYVIYLRNLGIKYVPTQYLAFRFVYNPV